MFAQSPLGKLNGRTRTTANGHSCFLSVRLLPAPFLVSSTFIRIRRADVISSRSLGAALTVRNDDFQQSGSRRQSCVQLLSTFSFSHPPPHAKSNTQFQRPLFFFQPPVVRGCVDRLRANRYTRAATEKVRGRKRGKRWSI